MDFFEALFKDAPKDTWIEVAHGRPPNSRSWFRVPDFLDNFDPKEYDDHCFFAPVLRSDKSSLKESCDRSRTVWVDYDRTEFPRPTFPPSYIVHSGHGWHLYWLLNDWVTDREAIEQANKILIEDIDGDKACWNVNRLMRVPKTPNEDTWCEVRYENAHRRYDLGDIQVLSRLDRKARHKIRTGDRRGYRSRSERDWAVCKALVSAGASDELIEFLFKEQPVGDKYREPTTAAAYLTRTIERVRSRVSEVSERPHFGIEAREDGYYVTRRKQYIRVSTFTIDPEILLDGGPHGAEDAILGTVRAGGFSWPEVTFTRSAFTGVRNIDKETPLMAWQWLGSDYDVRSLLPHLMEKLKEKGLPRTGATHTLGLHKLGERWVFVANDYTLGADELWKGKEAPLVYLDSRREHPVLDLSNVDKPSQELLNEIGSVLPNINTPEVIWPIIGWYASCMFKTVFEAHGIRFPILNVHGTRGSGKTTTIQRVMMPLFGQLEPKSYDANTTRFVALSLLGSTNAVPIAFSEFRFGAADKFLRYVLLSYDTGHDPRGRADQTTVDYPLSAPFSVDGEDLIADPAAKERIVAVTLRPATVLEGSECHDAFRRLSRLDLKRCGPWIIHKGLQLLMDEQFEDRLQRAIRDMGNAFPQRIPDRIRNNCTVALFGAYWFSDLFGIARPEPLVLGKTLRAVYDTNLGRSFVIADEMVEDICNAANGRSRAFSWEYDHANRTLWFQLSGGYGWWLAYRRRTNRGVLGRDAIRNQLMELEYIEKPKVVNETWMYGVRLEQAAELGLDVPKEMNITTLEINL